MSRDTGKKLLAVLAALLLWQAAAMLTGLPVLFPPPLHVLASLVRLLPQADTWLTLGCSFGRIALGFVLGLALGCGAAVAAARFPVVETLLWPWLEAIKSVPVVSVIILLVVWVSAGQLVVLLTVLMVFPLIYGNLLEGIRAVDVKLLQMAKRFGVPPLKRLRCIHLPQLKSWLQAGCSAALGLAWKAGAAAEVIGVVSRSIGERLYLAKVHFEIAELLAWTVLIVLCSGLCERLFRLLLDWLCRRWSRL